MPDKPSDVFINCPFDPGFDAGFKAYVFAVRACGFRARCAREMDDGTEARLDKLYRIIDQSRFAIHDLSRTDPDAKTGLPRFNMPFELGIFMAAKRFGGEGHSKKACIVFDSKEHRYEAFISDLKGIDVTPHDDDPRIMVESVRNWLVTVSKRKSIPGTLRIIESYDRFVGDLPGIAGAAGLKHDRLTFPDYERLVIAWIKEETVMGNLP